MIEARALLLVDGSSDEPLGRHVQALARRHGVTLVVVTPAFDRMQKPPGRRVRDRLDRILAIDDELREFKRDVPEYRRRLLDRLDRAGPVRRLGAWQAFDRATGAAMERLTGTSV